MDKLNKKMHQCRNDAFYTKLRIWRFKEKREGRRVTCGGYTIKCGCCNDDKLKIFVDDDSLEIFGILASKKEWADLFQMLLNQQDGEKE